MAFTAFSDWLNDPLAPHAPLPTALRDTLMTTAEACGRIREALAQGALAGVLGAAGSDNVQGEAQKKLDVIANDLLLAQHQAGGHLAGMASEEMDDPFPLPTASGPYLLVFDPLDGSSNIDINAPVGTIFSVLNAGSADAASPDAYLQRGRDQVAAGYALYGASTQLVLSLGHGVYAFTWDPRDGQFKLTEGPLQIPAETQEFAINMSNERHWQAPVRTYVSELLAGVEGPRGKDFNMRWVAAMVADVHRLLHRGGVFLYPLCAKTARQGGKLRLLYEANPMGFLVEQAGGLASTGTARILDLAPERLHQRVSVMLGARSEVERLEALHRAGA